jgi:hypothetical protein
MAFSNFATYMTRHAQSARRLLNETSGYRLQSLQAA